MNLRVGLTNYTNGSTYDLSSRISSSAQLTLTDELERDVFQRVVGDLHTEMSNLHGEVISAFADSPAQTVWGIDLDVNGSRYWSGHLDPQSLNFDQRNLWAMMDAFSLTKRLWERAAQIRVVTKNNSLIRPSASWDNSLQSFWEWEELLTRLGEYGVTYSGIDCGPFATRQIYWMQPTTPAWGYAGRLQDLDPATTLADLMRAMSIHYNAYFYVDPVTRKLTMRARNGQPSSFYNVDSIISDRHDFNIRWLDTVVYDYLLSYATETNPAPTVASIVAHGDSDVKRNLATILAGTWTWKVVDVINGNGIRESDPLTVTITQPSWVTLNLPPSPIASKLTARYLYRQGSGIPAFALVTNKLTPTQTIYTDGLGSYILAQSPTCGYVAGTIDFYRGYRDDTGWSADIPVVSSIDTPPIGRSFDIRPQLQFLEAGGSGTMASDQAFYIYSFFMQDLDRPTYIAQYQEMLATKRRAMLTLKGVNPAFMIGQGITSKIISPIYNKSQNFIVKKISVDFPNETTTVEMLTI